MSQMSAYNKYKKKNLIQRAKFQADKKFIENSFPLKSTLFNLNLIFVGVLVEISVWLERLNRASQGRPNSFMNEKQNPCGFFDNSKLVFICTHM